MGSLTDIRNCNWGHTEMQQPLPPELQHGGELPPSSSRTHFPPPKPLLFPPSSSFLPLPPKPPLPPLLPSLFPLLFLFFLNLLSFRFFFLFLFLDTGRISHLGKSRCTVSSNSCKGTAECLTSISSLTPSNLNNRLSQVKMDVYVYVIGKVGSM